MSPAQIQPILVLLLPFRLDRTALPQNTGSGSPTEACGVEVGVQLPRAPSTAARK
jgi:hypothetical protein